MNKYKKYTRTKNGVASVSYRNQKASSKRRGHKPPNYTLEELKLWMFSNPSFDTMYNKWVDSGYDKYLKPSCDRLNDYLPYTFDNMRLVTWGENNKKYNSDKKNGINTKNCSSVIRISECGEEKRYYSISEASRDNGISKSGISLCCKGLLKSSGGFVWVRAF